MFFQWFLNFSSLFCDFRQISVLSTSVLLILVIEVLLKFNNTLTLMNELTMLGLGLTKGISGDPNCLIRVTSHINSYRYDDVLNTVYTRIHLEKRVIFRVASIFRRPLLFNKCQLDGLKVVYIRRTFRFYWFLFTVVMIKTSLSLPLKCKKTPTNRIRYTLWKIVPVEFRSYENRSICSRNRS